MSKEVPSGGSASAPLPGPSPAHTKELTSTLEPLHGNQEGATNGGLWDLFERGIQVGMACFGFVFLGLSVFESASGSLPSDWEGLAAAGTGLLYSAWKGTPPKDVGT